MVRRSRRVDGSSTMSVVGAVAGVAALATVLTAGFAAAATARMARVVVTPVQSAHDDVVIKAVSPDRSTVTLGKTPDTVVDGRYSLWVSGDRAHLRLGRILAVSDTTVMRRVDAVTFGSLRNARRGRISGWWYLRPEELGYPVSSVAVPTSGGSAPAWLFPAERGTRRWAIHVHGRGTRRQEALRAIPTFRSRGYTSLVVSYRNDGDAPNSADGRYGLGSTEWHDVDAALGYARAHGATDIVLVGWSMGGAIVLQTLTRSRHADTVRGVVLDSPVVDWVDTLEHQAAQLRLPGPITRAALASLSAPWGRPMTGLQQPIDLGAMDFTVRSAALSVPILLMHSDDDDFVPSTASRALAAQRPDIVTFVPFSVARHAKLWNHDADRWNDAIDGWLSRLARRPAAKSDAAASPSAASPSEQA
ncbi:MAG: alpha/beta fold hydrolase [Microbacteriaceae bacterium]|nr:MAG: alpha/beta fold hydrolase [Microbacteriaceae bacterium]